MKQDELDKILDAHKLWLSDDPKGEKANLHWANLRRADLRGTDLRRADLSEANLRRADLSGANLSEANLRWANLRWADLRGADLHSTNVLRFQFNQHEAICTGHRITIGCEDHDLKWWLENYETCGKKNNYSELEIKLYGQWIKMCAEVHGGAND